MGCNGTAGSNSDLYPALFRTNPITSFYIVFVCVLFASSLWADEFTGDYDGAVLQSWQRAPTEACVSASLLVAFVMGHTAQAMDEYKEYGKIQRYLTSKTGNVYDVMILTMQVRGDLQLHLACICSADLRHTTDADRSYFA